MKTTEQATDWVRLVSRQKSGRPQIGVWHQHDGEQTLCGFRLFDRAIPGTPPPGARTCRFCQLAVADG